MKLVEETMSVRESILLCIEHNIKGAVSQLNSFDNAKPNRLRGDQINALKGNLECIYHNVNVTGGGKRGKVILSGLKDKVQQKEDGRSENEGQPPSNEQLIMNDYIHKLLYDMYQNDRHMEYGLSGWTKELRMIDVDKLPMDKFERKIREVHVNPLFHVFKPSQIAREFKNAIYNMNTDVVKKSFNALSKSGCIEYAINYNIVKSNGKKEIVDKFKYDEIKKRRMEVLAEQGSGITEYNNALANPNPTKRVKDILEAVSNMFEKEFDCKFIYESYIITSVKGECKDVDRDDFTAAYWNDFIRRTERRQRLYDSKPKEEQTWLWRKLWAFNTLMFLEYLGVDAGGLLLKYETENIGRIIELSNAYQAWQDKDKPVGFGNVEDDEDIADRVNEGLEGLF